MAKFIVKFEFRDGSSWRDKKIGYHNMIVEAPDEKIAKSIAMNCESYKKVARLHKKLWGQTKGEVRLFVLERKSRWNNMVKS
jgi:hypothetical protein